MTEQEAESLRDLAMKATATAYAPYSNFHVGAAIQCENGKTYTGANVENASYGLTMCAERVAMFKAITDGGGRIIACAIAVRDQQIPYPCGACRQVLSEFGDEFPVFLITEDGEWKELLFSELMPYPFRF